MKQNDIIKEENRDCQHREKKTIPTKKGFVLVCYDCGHEFKEVKSQKTIKENF